MLIRCSSPGNFFESMELPFEAPGVVGAYWYISAKDRPPIPGWKYNGPGPVANGVILYKSADGKWTLDYLMHWADELPIADQVRLGGGNFQRGDYDSLQELIDLGTMDVYEELRPLLPALVNTGQLSSAVFSRYEQNFFKHINQDALPLEEAAL